MYLLLSRCLLCIRQDTEHFTYFVLTLLKTLLGSYYYYIHFIAVESQAQRDEKLAQDDKTSKWG